jgi:hypothetical protein
MGNKNRNEMAKEEYRDRTRDPKGVKACRRNARRSKAKRRQFESGDK